MDDYEKFKCIRTDLASIGLMRDTNEDHFYYCTPIGAEIIGWEGVDGIHYCFIPGFGEMVFAVNPESCCDYNVYPLAKNFMDFLQLVLAANGVTALEQMITFCDKNAFLRYENSPESLEYLKDPDVQEALNALKSTFQILPMENPYEYVTELQKSFDYSSIPFSNEYYEVTGLERPE